MPSEAQASWSGPLKTKKKSELQQICRQLDIEYKSESLKADLEQQIRDRFQELPNLTKDERFMRLDHASSSPSASSNTSVPASRRATRARSSSRPPRANDEDPQSSAEDNRPRSTRSPSRRTTLDHNSPDPGHSGTQKILVTVVNTEKDLSRHTPSKPKAVASQSTIQAQQLAKQSGQQAIESFNAFARYTARQTISLIQTIQKTFSCPWKLCLIAVLAELVFVIYSTVPHRQVNYVHPQPEGYRIPEPIIRLSHRIFSKSFLRPFLAYLGLTVIAPFVIGGLMNVPNSGLEKDSKLKFRASRDLKPSVFVYCATRLAVVSLVHLVFYPNYHFGWASQTLSPPILPNPSPTAEGEAPMYKHLAANIRLDGFEYLQYVTTGFGMLIALHRLIRPPV